MNVKEEEEKS